MCTAVLESHLDQTGQDPACGLAAAHLARGACSCEKKTKKKRGDLSPQALTYAEFVPELAYMGTNVGQIICNVGI